MFPEDDLRWLYQNTGYALHRYVDAWPEDVIENPLWEDDDSDNDHRTEYERNDPNPSYCGRCGAYLPDPSMLCPNGCDDDHDAEDDRDQESN